MLHMKISKSWILKICFIAGLFLFAQFSFATDTTVLLPPDGSPKTPPTVPNGLTMEPSATATISDLDLTVYFDYSVGDATIMVYDANNNVVFQETVNSTSSTSISVSNWATGDYMITVTYGSTTQRGYFNIE